MNQGLSRGKRLLLQSSSEIDNDTTGVEGQSNNNNNNNNNNRHEVGSCPSSKRTKPTTTNPTMAPNDAATDSTNSSSSAPALSTKNFFSLLPDDLYYNVTTFLDAKSLATIRRVSKTFYAIASKNEAGWTNLCQELWHDKIHVCAPAKACEKAMEAYKLSIQDATNRDYVTREELIYDPITHTGSIWSFRFKESAGPNWTSWDPWYNGSPCRRMVFLADGTVKQYVIQSSEPTEHDASSGDGGTGDHGIGDSAALATTPITTEGQEILALPQFHQNGVLVNPPLPMTWRFLTRPLDLPERPIGSYIRFAVGDREVPTYCVRRSPTKNWGFVAESCWGIYASFELPKRPLRCLGRIQRRRLREVTIRRMQTRSGRWIDVEVPRRRAQDDTSLPDAVFHNLDETGIEADDENDDSINNISSTNMLLVDDSSFSITSNLQWREAFLYNFGTERLPEGEEAVAEFDRTYGAALQT